MPIRIAFALMQMAVYTFGASQDVAEMTKKDGACINFKWVLYNKDKGVLEILHCDDKPSQQLTAVSVRKAHETADTHYHVEMERARSVMTAAIDLPQSKGGAALQEDAGHQRSEGVPNLTEDVKL